MASIARCDQKKLQTMQSCCILLVLFHADISFQEITFWNIAYKNSTKKS